MGFTSVYRVLQEVFPQIDSRILRAVAIEHSKDADVAVEVVLVEVLPQISQQSSLLNDNDTKGKSSLIVSEDVGKAVNPVGVVSLFSKLLTEAGPSNTVVVEEPVVSGSLGVSSYHDAIAEINTVSDNPDTDLVCEKGSFDMNNEESVEIEGENIALASDSIVTEDTGPDFHTETLIAESNLDDSTKTASEKGDSVVNSEDESIMSSALTKSDHNCSTELLEEIIEDARNSKKTLVSTMDSVVNLMKEVESKEKEVEQVKEEATKGCSDILSKVDEVKQALQRAKEANDMHAGEVYAEKAILATEMKELQLRLFTLSDERNKSLEILDEMRKGLEIRLDAALKEIEAAEEIKMEKEKCAREALAFQEIQMEKVVEESKKLKLEAEENSKLQEFLMDRGHAIDMLQGEISIKCQDVRVLKEKFDKRIPLSRSLSSSYTLSVLASPSSSFRSIVTPDIEHEIYGTPKITSPKVADNGLLAMSESSKSEKENNYSTYSTDDNNEEKIQYDGDHKKQLDEDGWELFEKEDWNLNA